MFLAYLFTFGEVIVEIAFNKAQAMKRGISTRITRRQEDHVAKEDIDESFKKHGSASGAQNEGRGDALNDADSDVSALDISEQSGPKNTTSTTATVKQENRRENTGANRHLLHEGHSSADASHLPRHRRTVTPDGDIESCGAGDYGINMQYLLCMMSTPKEDEALMLQKKENRRIDPSS